MKYYDKIFLLVSVLILCAGVGFFFLKAPEIQKTENTVKSLLAKKAEGIVWEEIPVPEWNISPIEWPEIRPQDEEGKWFFQVFTPPKIWIDDGVFKTESPHEQKKLIASFAYNEFGGVSNVPYPIKYLGFMGTKEAPRVQFVNEETGLSFMGKFGEEIIIPASNTSKEVDLGLKVTGFDTKRIKNKDNTISQIVTVTLFDKELGKEIEIYSNKQTLLEDRRRLTLKAKDKDGNVVDEWHIKAVGEERDFGDSKYVVKALDFDNETVVVEMIPNKKEIPPQAMKLSASGVEKVK